MLAPAILQRTNRAEGAQKRLLALSCEESRSVGASSVAHRIRPFCFCMVGSIAVATFGFVLRLFVQPVRAFLGRSLADVVIHLQPSNAGSDGCAGKCKHSSTSFMDAFNAVHSIDAALFTLKSSRQLFLVRLGFLFALKLQAVVGRIAAGYLKRKLLAGAPPAAVFLVQTLANCRPRDRTRGLHSLHNQVETRLNWYFISTFTLSVVFCAYPDFHRTSLPESVKEGNALSRALWRVERVNS